METPDPPQPEAGRECFLQAIYSSISETVQKKSGFSTPKPDTIFFSSLKINESYNGVKTKPVVKSMDCEVIFSALKLGSNCGASLSSVTLSKILNFSEAWFAHL